MKNLEDALQKGGDPNLAGPGNMTALHLAVLLCQEEMVARLLQAGAKLEVKDKNGMTPLAYATLPVQETPLPQLKLMMKTSDGVAILDTARANIRSALLAAGADWNAKSNKGQSAWESFAHFYPEQANSMIPQVGPARL